jgi:hypothetical protein
MTPSNHSFDPDNILHALKHTPTQRHGAYLGVCNHTNCQRPITHGEPVTIHACYSECNSWRITNVYCRDHDPHTAFNTDHSRTTAIATAIFNHPTTIPPRNHPVLSDFQYIETRTELPQLPNPAESTLGESKYVVSPEELRNGDYTTEEEFEDLEDRDTQDGEQK